MNKKLKKAFKGVACLGLMGTALYFAPCRDSDGNSPVDHVYNAVPAMSGRPLTPREKELARSVFGNHMNYDVVRLRKPVLGLSWGNFKPQASADSNHISFENLPDDFLDMPIKEQSSFIHEMAHVWQHQSGRSVPFEALTGFIATLGDYGSLYKLPNNRVFSSLNHEQQAVLIERLFYCRETNSYCTDEVLDLESRLDRNHPLHKRFPLPTPQAFPSP